MLPAGLELRLRVQYTILAYFVASVKRQEVRSGPRPGACPRVPAAHLPDWQDSPFADNTCRRRTEHLGGCLQSHDVQPECGVGGGSGLSQQAMNRSVQRERPGAPDDDSKDNGENQQVEFVPLAFLGP